MIVETFKPIRLNWITNAGKVRSDYGVMTSSMIKIADQRYFKSLSGDDLCHFTGSNGRKVGTVQSIDCLKLAE